jgi:hypothetical protein
MLNSKKQITLNYLDNKFDNISLFLLPIFFSSKNYLQIKNLTKFEFRSNDFCFKRKNFKHVFKFSKKNTLKNYFKSLNKKNLKFSTKKLKFLQHLNLKKKTTNNFLKNQHLKQQVATKINITKNLKFSPIFLSRRNLKDTHKLNRFSKFVFILNSVFSLTSFKKHKQIKMQHFKSRLNVILTIFLLKWRYNSFFFFKKKSLWSGLFGLKAFKVIKKGKFVSKSQILSNIKILKKKKNFCLKNKYLFNFLSLK